MTATTHHNIPTQSECTTQLHTLAATRVKLIRRRSELATQLRELTNQLDRLDWQLSGMQISEEWLMSVAHHPSNQTRC